jgi:hypothetical protein
MDMTTHPSKKKPKNVAKQAKEYNAHPNRFEIAAHPFATFLFCAKWAEIPVR